jgi:hypothetical protein
MTLNVSDNSRLEIRFLPTSAVVPNSYNPNTMSTAEFDELVEEVRHLGRLSKPVVVTPQGEGWQIVDGEHSWRAALAVGLAEVPCEVIATDPFEAMRQTYKRNQHGRHDPVRLGRMFLAMMANRGLSGRDLATEVSVSEGTVRNAVIYANGAELRNGYEATLGGNSGDSDRAIAKLTVREVREYMRLPRPIRDEWLDAGADLKILQKAEMVRIDEDGKSQVVCFGRLEGETDPWQELVDAGVADRVTSEDFVSSAHEAFRLLMFRRRHAKDVENLDAYLKPVVDWFIPSSIVGHLPCGTFGDRSQVLISPPRWTDIVRDCAQRSENRQDLESLIRASIGIALQDAGIEARDISDPRTIRAQRAVDKAPAFIRESSLSLAEKHVLAILVSNPDVPHELALEGGRRACEMLERLRIAVRAGRTSEIPRAQLRLLSDGGCEIAFGIAVVDIAKERMNADRLAILADRERLTDVLMERIARSDSPASVRAPTGTDIRSLLLGHLAAIPMPEFQLLSATALGWDGGLERWLDTVLPASTSGDDLGEPIDGRS